MGAPGTSFSLGPNHHYGFNGSNGYNALGSNFTYIVNGPSLTGGVGGTITGTDPSASYYAGGGGAGLSVTGATTVTISSGTFTGGTGGMANGIGQSLTSGYGGDGLVTYGGATTSIYGGTFQGGLVGDPTARTGSGGDYGSGLYEGATSIVNVFGGSFAGGNGLPVPSGYTQEGGSGLYVRDGSLNIYGGTFAGGTSSFGSTDLEVIGGTATLYGSNFTVNGVAVENGSVPVGFGTITGNLLDNSTVTTLNYFLYDGSGGTLNIESPAAVPEASTTVSFGLLLTLGLGGVMLARKKSAVA